jgi:hypothetical protein
MSVSGILAGSLFSNAASLFGGNSPSAAKGSPAGHQPSFKSLQQQLSASSPGATAGATSVSNPLATLGQDLNSGNLAAAQADFSAFRLAMSHGPAAHTGNPQSQANSMSGSANDPLAAAMQAYSSLQLSPMTNGMSTSLMSPASMFDVSA